MGAQGAAALAALAAPAGPCTGCPCPPVPGLSPRGDPDPSPWHSGSRSIPALAPTGDRCQLPQWAPTAVGQAGGESCGNPPQRALLLSVELPALSGPGCHARLLEEGITREESSLGSAGKSRWHSNTNAALKHWKKEMLPVLNHKSTAHWPLGCCCCAPCPAQHAVPRGHGCSGDVPPLGPVPQTSPGLHQLLSHRRVMNVVQISPFLTSCSVYYCKTISFFYLREAGVSRGSGTVAGTLSGPVPLKAHPIQPFSTPADLWGSVTEKCTRELGLRTSGNFFFISFSEGQRQRASLAAVPCCPWSPVHTQTSSAAQPSLRLRGPISAISPLSLTPQDPKSP